MNPFVFDRINDLLNSAKWDQEKLNLYGIDQTLCVSNDEIKTEIEKKLGHPLQWEEQLVFAGDGFAIHELLCLGA